MTYAAQKDISGFWKDERPGEYEARFSVTGEVRVTIKAESKDEAWKLAEAMMDDDELGIDIDEVTDVSLDWVNKTPAMFLVKRGEKTMRVSRITEGDEPREPDERGF